MPNFALLRHSHSCNLIRSEHRGCMTGHVLCYAHSDYNNSRGEKYRKRSLTSSLATTWQIPLSINCYAITTTSANFTPAVAGKTLFLTCAAIWTSLHNLHNNLLFLNIVHYSLLIWQRTSLPLLPVL